jgi:hypothetical protein
MQAMNEDIRKLEEANLDFSLKLAIGFGILMGLLGVYFYFIKGLASLDFTLLPYVIVYAGLSVVAFFSFKNEKAKEGAVIGGVALLVLILSVIKISWQNKQFERQEPFIFYEHVEKFPTWEGYLLAPVLKSPNWLLFAKECGYPVIQKKPFNTACASMASIQGRYNINAMQEINDYHGRMQRTAMTIEKRGSMNGVAYRECILKKECAEIPLLPNDVNPDEIQPGDDRYNHISRPYWDLVEKKPLTPELCDYITLCRVLRQTGAMTFDQTQ